ncbi:hypothetical protein [Burkholderia territorii]|uniref:hypothetical protein n=1 Tax=Burkholderia territorii TaxID=1503055 RepID=UPI0012DA4172|nr:hypothetical protein [Burkholderia territorii]
MKPADARNERRRCMTITSSFGLRSKSCGHDRQVEGNEGDALRQERRHVVGVDRDERACGDGVVTAD